MNRQHFRHLGKEFREVPFWSWNDELDPAELRRQIDMMVKAGWGGFFMHSRMGLKTPYLGKKWMECIRASVEEARQRGMGAWLYDEDKWPSRWQPSLPGARRGSWKTFNPGRPLGLRRRPGGGESGQLPQQPALDGRHYFSSLRI